MGTFDIIAIVVIVIFAIVGFFVGFLRRLGNWVAYLAGTVVGYFFATLINASLLQNGAYGWLIDLLNGNDQLASTIMFLVLFSVISFVVSFILKLVLKPLIAVIKITPPLLVVDRIIGIAFGALNGLFVFCLILVVCGYIAPHNADFADWLTNDLNSGAGIAKGLYGFVNSAINSVKEA